MGHEFTGTVKEVGSKVKTLKIGDRVVSPFTVSWYLPCLFKSIFTAILTLIVENASIA